MTIKVVDLLDMAQQPGVRRKVLMNGPKFHTWLHVYSIPGERDEMHCHNADQTFYCLEGECTMHFPDGGKTTLTPGMVALIPGGQFYQLENSSKDKMVLMGTRALSNEASMKIDYETRKDLNEGKKGTPPKATKVLV
jgi:mannose-6-phosphate isomerase-like protein (cupin superfamily)